MLVGFRLAKYTAWPPIVWLAFPPALGIHLENYQISAAQLWIGPSGKIRAFLVIEHLYIVGLGRNTPTNISNPLVQFDKNTLINISFRVLHQPLQNCNYNVK